MGYIFPHTFKKAAFAAKHAKCVEYVKYAGCREKVEYLTLNSLLE